MITLFGHKNHNLKFTAKLYIILTRRAAMKATVHQALENKI